MSSIRAVVLVMTALSFAAAPVRPAAADESRSKPNLVVILVDDMGYSDVGAFGCKDIPTPRIDSLARNGTRFTNAYATCPLCSPSRAAIMTGRYQERYGIESALSPDRLDGKTSIGLDVREKTLADLLKQQGYATAAIGKWHLGDQPQYLPNRRGFDYFYGYLEWGHYYLNPSRERLAKGDYPWFEHVRQYVGAPHARYLSRVVNCPIYRNEKISGYEGYLTDVLHDEAVRFIEQNRQRPFFLYLAEAAMHAPLEASQKYLDRFPNLSDTDLRRTYAAAMSALDDGVGRVLDTLKKYGLEQNTLIVFTSDNGGPSFWKPRPEVVEFVREFESQRLLPSEKPDYRKMCLQRQWGIGANGSNNLPLSFGKQILYEGGVRVPCIVQWPGVAPAGTTSDAIISGLDVLPTFVAAAGGKLPADRQYDGVDLRPYFEGKIARPTERTLFWRYYTDRAIRENQWKMFWTPYTKAHLYDITRDIEEEKDLADQHPDVVRRLQEKWMAWDKQNLPPKIERLPKLPPPKASGSSGDSRSPASARQDRAVLQAILRAVE